MFLAIKRFWKKNRNILAAGAAAILVLYGQGGHAEAAMKVPEDVYQWVQSSPRMNYFFNKQVMHYMVDRYGDIVLDELYIPVVKSFDDLQIQDVLQKRRWKMLDTEDYEALGGQAEYVRLNTRLQKVYVDKVQMLDSWMGVIEEKEGTVIDLAKLTDKHLEKQFYAGVLEYVFEHQDEILKQTKGNLKKADEERIAKERYERAHPKKKKKKNKDKKPAVELEQQQNY